MTLGDRVTMLGLKACPSCLLTGGMACRVHPEHRDFVLRLSGEAARAEGEAS